MRNDCFGCQTRENNLLCSLFRTAHKIVKGDSRKLTRNPLQNDASEIEILPEILQDKASVNKRPHDIHNTRTSTLPMSQTNIFQVNASKSYKIRYESGGQQYATSVPPKLQNSDLKGDTEKQVTVSNMIYYDPDTYPKDVKTYLSMPHNNFKRDIEEQVTDSNIIHHETTRHPKGIKTVILSEDRDNRSVRIKREAVKDSLIYFDLDKTPKAEKGIKILEQEPGETQCNYNQCVEICNTIYFAIPIHLAQCYNNTCFCFPKKDLYPPVIKNFLKTHTLFGIQQTYE